MFLGNYISVLSGNNLVNNCHQNHPNQFCKMSSHNRVTEALRHRVVQMKSCGLSLSAIEKNIGRSKSIISKISKLHNTNSFNSAEKVGLPHKTNPRKYRMIQRLSMEGPLRHSSLNISPNQR